MRVARLNMKTIMNIDYKDLEDLDKINSRFHFQLNIRVSFIHHLSNTEKIETSLTQLHFKTMPSTVLPTVPLPW